jgi:hypothetical protein
MMDLENAMHLRRGCFVSLRAATPDETGFLIVTVMERADRTRRCGHGKSPGHRYVRAIVKRIGLI